MRNNRLKHPLMLAMRQSVLLSLCVVWLSGCNDVGGEQQPDPVAQEFPIAYVKRPIPVDEDAERITTDFRTPAEFMPGAALYLRDQASPSSSSKDISTRAFATEEEPNPLYDVRDVSPSYDGTKLLFSMRAPEIEDADEEDQPKWNIWEYDIELDELRRVIVSDTLAEAGDDIMPAYLPDERIVFSSTRQSTAKAILLDEGKPQYAGQEESRMTEGFALHVMNNAGLEIQQITYNPSHDIYPTVLKTGEILFTRWDNMANNNAFNLYKIHPDGTNQSIVYGHHSHNTGTNNSNLQFYRSYELEDGDILTFASPVRTQVGGTLIKINYENFTDINQTTDFASGIVTGSGQSEATALEVTTDGSPSAGGHFSSAYPLYDNSGRFFISWSPCRLQTATPSEDPDADPTITINTCTDAALEDEDAEEAPPLFGIWMYTPSSNTLLPVVVGEEGIIYTDVVAAEPRLRPNVILDVVPEDASLVNNGLGILHIRSVYDVDGSLNLLGSNATETTLADFANPENVSFDQRPARFLKIIKHVAMPDDDVYNFEGTAFGASNNQLMREIVGYAPIQPDGSVKVKVPANIPFAIGLLNDEGERISVRHQNWLQVRPGETLECNGCHTRQSTLPHGRPDAEAASINLGAPTTGAPFPGTDPAKSFTNMGETMAEMLARVMPESMDLSVNVTFTDLWTDPAATPADNINLTYANLTTPAPTSDACITSWTPLCRITINYVTHIDPIWSVVREEPNDIDPDVTDIFTCTHCHSTIDADDQTRVPLAQLDLSEGPSDQEADHLKSYRELLFNDLEQVLNEGGLLVNREEPLEDGQGNIVFERNDDGSLRLDENDEPIPVLRTFTVTPVLSVAGSRSSTRFFNLFAEGGSHQGWLTPAELKLLSEWVDIGAQYYNNPFAAPEQD